MSKNCERYQSRLIDIFYEEESMNDEIQSHIESCSHCKKFWDELHEMKIVVDKSIVEPPIDYENISQAFEKVEEIRGRRINLFDLVLFIIISGLLLGTIAFIGLKGYLIEIIYFQIAMYIIIPLTLPVIIKIRSLKEDFNERN